MFEETHSQIAHTRCYKEFHSFKAARLKKLLIAGPMTLKTSKLKLSGKHYMWKEIRFKP